MTSINSESAATIAVSCKQTRFHIESPNYRELDVEGLSITVKSAPAAAPGSKVKGKGKAKPEGTEILSDAKLKLQAGQRYALLGRNGSGKSTLIKAIVDKLIPGIPEKTRVSILQQTRDDGLNADTIAIETAADGPGRTVFEEVVERATAKHELEQEIRALSSGIDSSDPYAPVRAIRKVRHERLLKQHFRLDKDARLRSGARGLQARKALVVGEKAVAESSVVLEQADGDISAETLQEETQEAIDMLADLQLQVEPTRISEVESRAKRILTGLGFTEAYMAKPVDSLSGGWRMRTALTTALLQDTDILILDEPTNFLDLLGILWLQRYLEALQDEPEPPTLIVVSHDRDFISLCTDLIILKDKKLVYFHGDLPTYESSQADRKLWLAKMKEAQEKQRAHMQKTIANNIKQGKAKDDENKLRQAKSRQKRLEDRLGMVNENGTRFKLNRDRPGFHTGARDEIEVPQEERAVTVALPEPADLRFPGPLISLEGVGFRYPGDKGGATLVLQDVNLSVNMGDRIGVLGLNGAGKSTLVKLLVGGGTPSKGAVTTHPRLKLGYYSQHAVEELQAMGRADRELTALALLVREVEGELDEGQVRGILGSIGLPGRLASDVPVAKLSGGQLVRLELSRILWKRPHCLVLDEVTTHLDYETVRALREALRGWGGAVVLVSHDRWFMRGAVENSVDEDESEDEGGPEGEDTTRRVVCRLRAGKMEVLAGGVTEFEERLEKRVRKLLV
ncbi:related to positive effector protein GCN20 [Cephalotrichum gorgonifer]|uniref:Related to positive effector protein GCN20 n=1 Tax=Cephalotrichum gorgonifer TaxID=2041049 RepID=A0AAE8SYS8_9PEZI|nr:related to positive effector protein GCN20 [Cephalotrichum gorgonifer]